MNRRILVVASAVIIGGVLMLAGFGFAYDIYVGQQNCQEMDAQPDVTANCWAFPNKLLVTSGILLGLGGTGLVAGSIRWYRHRTDHSSA
jgi:uncharacterized membrane protein